MNNMSNPSDGSSSASFRPVRRIFDSTMTTRCTIFVRLARKPLPGRSESYDASSRGTKNEALSPSFEHHCLEFVHPLTDGIAVSFQTLQGEMAAESDLRSRDITEARLLECGR